MRKNATHKLAAQHTLPQDWLAFTQSVTPRV